MVICGIFLGYTQLRFLFTSSFKYMSNAKEWIEQVPYGKTNDFYYSGHVGCCLLSYLEFKANGWFKFAYFSLVTMILQASLMIFLRSHYSIDIFGGLVFAHYIWMMAEKYSYFIDVKLFRIPFYKRFPYMY